MTEPETPTQIATISLAAFSLAHELCLALLKSGAISHNDVDDIFSRSITDHTQIGTPTNLEVASVLSRLKKALDSEWPRDQAWVPPPRTR